jgi:steroid 5-alpha reductase family enzyme
MPATAGAMRCAAALAGNASGQDPRKIRKAQKWRKQGAWKLLAILKQVLDIRHVQVVVYFILAMNICGKCHENYDTPVLLRISAELVQPAP